MSRYLITLPAKQDLREINNYLTRFSPIAVRRIIEGVFTDQDSPEEE